MMVQYRRRVKALEERLTRRAEAQERFRLDRITEAWFELMSIEDLELMELIASRLEAGEDYDQIIESLDSSQRERVNQLYADRERIKRAFGEANEA